MSISRPDQLTPSLDGRVRDGVALPMDVFCQKFGSYAFFDLDIATSLELAVGLMKLIEDCADSGEQVSIFSAESREHLGTLTMGRDWADGVLQVGRSLRGKGDCGGMILVPVSGKWLAFQSRPVDVGVIALNCDDKLSLQKSGVDECFFDCGDIAEWMTGTTDRDANLRENYGDWLLQGLIVNYCRG